MEPIAKDKIGAEGEYEIVFEEGKLIISAKYEGAGGGASVSLHGDAVYLIDKITDAIPGEWDDMVLDGLAQKLLAKKSV